jgi:hypothetical protein
MATDSKKDPASGKPRLQPKDRPDRQEMIFALSTDGKTIRSRNWKILRNWQEQITRLEENSGKGYTEFGGWIATLLGAPATPKS